MTIHIVVAQKPHPLLTCSVFVLTAALQILIIHLLLPTLSSRMASKFCCQDD